MFLVMLFLGGNIFDGVMQGTTGYGTAFLTAEVAKPDPEQPATTITVDNTAVFPPSGVIFIRQEIIKYKSKTPTVFSGLTRGHKKTETSVHPVIGKNGSTQIVYSEGPGVINNLVGFNIAEAFSDGGVTGFFKGVFSSITQVPAFIQSIARMVMWDYAYLEGPYVWVKYFLYIISAGVVLGMFKLALGR